MAEGLRTMTLEELVRKTALQVQEINEFVAKSQIFIKDPVAYSNSEQESIARSNSLDSDENWKLAEILDETEEFQEQSVLPTSIPGTNSERSEMLGANCEAKYGDQSMDGILGVRLKSSKEHEVSSLEIDEGTKEVIPDFVVTAFFDDASRKRDGSTDVSTYLADKESATILKRFFENLGAYQVFDEMSYRYFNVDNGSMLLEYMVMGYRGWCFDPGGINNLSFQVLGNKFSYDDLNLHPLNNAHDLFGKMSEHKFGFPVESKKCLLMNLLGLDVMGFAELWDDFREFGSIESFIFSPWNVWGDIGDHKWMFAYGN